MSVLLHAVTHMKISESRRGVPATEETRHKMRLSQLHGLMTDLLHAVTRVKMSESARGRILSEETRQKMRLSQRERRREEESRVGDDERLQSSESEVPTSDPADAPKKRRPRRTDWNKQARKGTAVSAVPEE